LKNFWIAIEKLINHIVGWSRDFFKLSRPATFSNIVYFSNNQNILIFGRIIEESPLVDFNSDGTSISHFFKMLRLLLSFKVSGVTVSVSGSDCENSSNKDGYFHLLVDDLDLSSIETVTLIGTRESQKGSKITFQKELCDISTLPEPLEIFISDIDDTVIKSRATSFSRLAFNTLFRPPHKRQAFPEAASAYQKMLSKSSCRRFFYVSSSTWSIYPLLKHFLDLNKFPEGPILLQDIEGEKRKASALSHGHKLEKIHQIANLFPSAQLTLIGDAGQEDVEIYMAVARELPRRVKKILIRRSWWKSISDEPLVHPEEAQRLEVEFMYFDTLEELS
jgi:phosphatidate phosphatase APP1